jgi:putative ABC transport system permease protein
LRHAYEPTILWNWIPNPLYYTIKFDKVDADGLKNLLTTIESEWKEVFPDNHFHYFFFYEQFNDQYQADARLGQIIVIFSILAVFIACLGLFGLTSYMISVRTKEIGIRKVLGSSVAGIVHVLTRDFIKLVMVALIIGIPLAFYFGNQWLENFAYKSSIRWWIFGVAGLIASLIAGVTVSLQSIHAALANPIDALRNE